MNVNVKLNRESPESREARRVIFDLVTAIQTPAYGAELSSVIGDVQPDSLGSTMRFVTLLDNAVFILGHALASLAKSEHGLDDEPVDWPELLYRLQKSFDGEDG